MISNDRCSVTEIIVLDVFSAAYDFNWSLKLISTALFLRKHSKGTRPQCEVGMIPLCVR